VAANIAAPKRRRILCVGMPVRDLLFRIEAVPTRGQKVRASHFEELSGGNAPNAAIAIARLGGEARLCGPMGDEPGISHILTPWQNEGIDTSEVLRIPGTVTPISSIMIDAAGERTIVTHRDPALWQITLPPADELLDGIDAVLTENRCSSFVAELCAEALRRGIPVVLDADRVMTLDDAVLTASSHVIFSADALRTSAKRDDLAAALAEVATLTPAYLAVTSGAEGTLWRDADSTVRHLPAFPVAPVDTLGAGDVFHGAFALAIAEGQDPLAALRFGAAAAALKCTRHGGAFAAPQRLEVEALLRA
jgi:sugar/nucleoside kinase (ribokinase family)